MRNFVNNEEQVRIEKTITNTVMMVRPANFGYNEETAKNNAFQHKAKKEDNERIKLQAIEEFMSLVAKLREHGITVEVIQDSNDVIKPDAIFPNNWVSFHEGGVVITYPMHAVKRRTERKLSIIEEIGERYEIASYIKYEDLEAKSIFLEGTGSMILDRYHKIAYACASERTDEVTFRDFCKKMEFTPVWFRAVDQHDTPIYHTNVMMCVGVSFVVICMESIKDEVEKNELLSSFQKTNKEVIVISLDQVSQFAGNMIQLRNHEGTSFLIMSSQAYESLEENQIQQIEKYTTIIHNPLPTIETYGGGSARCMIAELFLTKIKEHH